ncbi:MAG: hypothetical protein R3B45_14265 [Bdellovibrionota bacterium]
MLKNTAKKLNIETLQITSFIALGLLCLSFFLGKHINSEWNRFHAYSESQVFGKNCKIAEGVWKENDSFEKVRDKAHAYRNASMPYRQNSPLQKPRPKPGQYAITKCLVNLSTVKNAAFLAINLGPLYGHSAVFVANRLLLIQKDNGIAEFTIPPQERKNETEITIISRKLDQGDNLVGLPTSVPIFFTDSREIAFKLKVNSQFFAKERPLFVTAIALSLASVFIACWILGIRYADIYWLIIFLVCTALSYAILYRDGMKLSIHQVHLSHFFANASIISYLAFIYSFLRFKKYKNALPYFFLATLGTYIALYFLTPASLRALIGYSYHLTSVITGILIIVLCIIGKFKYIQLSGKRKRQYQFSWYIFLISGIYFLTSPIITKYIDYPISSTFTFAVIFLSSINLTIDLATFHQRFFQANNRKSKLEVENIKYEDDIGTIKHFRRYLNQPKNTQNTKLDYCLLNIQKTEFQSSWLYLYPSNDGTESIIFGESNTTGPASTIVITTIYTSIRQSVANNLSLDQAIKNINACLSSLFKGDANTSLISIKATNKNIIEVNSYGKIKILELDNMTNQNKEGTSSYPIGIYSTFKKNKESIPAKGNKIYMVYTPNINDNNICPLAAILKEKYQNEFTIEDFDEINRSSKKFTNYLQEKKISNSVLLVKYKKAKL